MSSATDSPRPSPWRLVGVDSDPVSWAGDGAAGSDFAAGPAGVEPASEPVDEPAVAPAFGAAARSGVGAELAPADGAAPAGEGAPGVVGRGVPVVGVDPAAADAPEREGRGEVADDGDAVAPDASPESAPGARRGSCDPWTGRTAGRRGSPAGGCVGVVRPETGESLSVRSVLGVASGPTPATAGSVGADGRPDCAGRSG